ncbi:MAG: T9SS type A sorting domain-containing protein [Bacteroidetes bacterium]|nr:T9SS type A sorting domain-containing protein [Bacteroidota bacterium]
MRSLYYCSLLFTLLLPWTLHAQREADHWFFGEWRGLYFGNGAPEVIPDTTYTNLEGGSALSTPGGDLQLYSDGMVVWDRNGKRFPNGQDLISNYSMTNAALCVPRPGSDRFVYIITTYSSLTPLAGLRYSLADLRFGDGYGIISRKNIPLMTGNGVSEGVTAVHHANGRDIWLIAPRLGTIYYHAWLLTDNGFVNDPVTSTLKRPTEHTIDFRGEIKTSFDGSKVAMVRYGSNEIDLLRFNNVTGALSNQETIPLPRLASSYIHHGGLNTQSPYGLEFSLDGKKIYVSTLNTGVTSYLFQITIDDDEAVPDTRYEVNVIDSIPARLPYHGFGLLQMAPDRRIYIAMFNHSDSLGVINNPDAVGPACGFEAKRFPFPQQDENQSIIGKVGLPGFVQSFFNPLRFSTESFCLGSGTIFRASRMRDNDSVRWHFDDIASGRANTDTGAVAVHRFSLPGDYNVSAILFADGRADTVRQLVRIYDAPVVRASAGDTALCPGTSTRLLSAIASGRAPYLVEWYPPEYLDDAMSPSPVASPPVSTTFHVRILDDNGCVAEDSVRIHVRTPLTLTAMRDTVLCGGGTLRIGGSISGGLPPYQFSWSPGESLDNASAATPLATPSKSTTYHLLITDAAGCILRDSVRVTVREAPVLTALPYYRVCAGDSIPLAVLVDNETEPLLVEWIPDRGLSDARSLTPVCRPSETTRYLCRVTAANGCDATVEIDVIVPPPLNPVIRGDTMLCPGAGTRLAVSDEHAAYLWSTGDRTPAITVTAAGTYSVTVHDDDGCAGTASVRVGTYPDAQLRISGPEEFHEGEEVILDAGEGFHSYAWSTGENGRTLVAGAPGTYRVEVIDSNGCRWSATHVLQMKARPHAVFALSDIEAAPGDTIEIELRLIDALHLEDFASLYIEGELRFHRSVLYPLHASFHDAGNERRVTVSARSVPGEDAPLFRLPCMVLLGAVEETALTLHGYNLEPSVISGEVINGRLRVTICREGGPRLFRDDALLRLGQNHPNPCNGTTVIRFTTIEAAPTRLDVFDIYGRLVATLTDGLLAPGTHSVHFDVTGLPSGQYHYVLRTPTAIAHRTMTVLK